MHSRFLLFSLLFLNVSTSAQAQKRVALVIGNAKYDHVGLLKNPINDAEALKQSLSQNGFKVLFSKNLRRKQMSKVFRKFRRLADKADIAIVYFSGHGIELNGQNYLIPIDAQLKVDEDIRYEAINLNEEVMRSVQNARSLGLVILDACRNNPFEKTITRSSGLTKSVKNGLAIVETTGNIIVAYAAKAGTVAYDGKTRHSPFAKALLDHAFKPNLDLRLAFGYITDQVKVATGYKQEPSFYGSFGTGPYILGPKKKKKTVSPKKTPPVIYPGNRCGHQDKSLWNMVEAENTEFGFEHYLREFPEGCFKSRARYKLALLRRKSGAIGVRPRQKERSCKGCPEMVRIKGGSFLMGTTRDAKFEGVENEVPQHRVRVPTFLVSKFEITNKQYVDFLNDVKKRGPAGQPWFKTKQQDISRLSSITGTKGAFKIDPGKEDHPITMVSWYGAQAYISWLSKKTGKPYRLLSEAEWEYAARAGNTTIHWWGDKFSHKHANNDDGTLPVRSLIPNPFGLYHILGNVSEWVQDCWHPTYDGAPSNGSAWEEANNGLCDKRVIRGGAWYGSVNNLRAAKRYKLDKFFRDKAVGFRVARDFVF